MLLFFGISSYGQEIADTTLARQHLQTAMELVDMNKDQEGLAKARRAALLYKKAEHWKGHINALIEIGSIYLFKLADYQAAKGYADRAIKVAEDYLSASDPILLDILYLSVQSHYYLGNARGVIKDLRKSIALTEAIYGPDDPSIAMYYVGMANIYYDQQISLDTAKLYYLRAEELFIGKNGQPDHELLPGLRQNIGTVFVPSRTKRRSLSLLSKLYRLSKDAGSAKLGRSNPHLSACSYNL